MNNTQAKNMDVMQAMHSKYFYGKEFLTWLWFKSETNTGRFTENIELWVDNAITLQSDDGENPDKVILKGSGAKMSEGMLALKNGKQVVEGKFILIMDDQEWSFMLDAFRLSFRALKTPKTMKQSEDEEDAYFLDKVKLIEKAVSAVDQLFKQFMDIRLEPVDWTDEGKKIWEWILRETESQELSAKA